VLKGFFCYLEISFAFFFSFVFFCEVLILIKTSISHSLHLYAIHPSVLQCSCSFFQLTIRDYRHAHVTTTTTQRRKKKKKKKSFFQISYWRIVGLFSQTIIKIYEHLINIYTQSITYIYIFEEAGSKISPSKEKKFYHYRRKSNKQHSYLFFFFIK
jgi:hypothetical protein